MTRQREKIAWGSAVIAVVLAVATSGMAMAPPDGAVRMSNLKVGHLVSDVGGFGVIDRSGAYVGEAISVDTDRRGLARWINVALENGHKARVASFRAWLDAREQTIVLQLPQDIVQRRAEADALNSPSAGI